MWDSIVQKSKNDLRLCKEKDFDLYYKLDATPAHDTDPRKPASEKKKLQVHMQKVKTAFASTIMVTTLRDITPMKELEKQRALIKLKTLAFGSAAHELKNPLNAIKNSLNLLEGRLTNP
jgi:nitrogen-specific signal transduction histidine kinase